MTVLFLVYSWVPKLPREIFRDLRHGPEDWALVPVAGFHGLMGGVVGLWLAGLLWPGAAVLLIRAKRQEKKRNVEAQVREFETLLSQVREGKAETGVSILPDPR